jgi:hypothetical protein
MWTREKRLSQQYILILLYIDLSDKRGDCVTPTPFKCPGLCFSNGMAARDFTVMILGFGTVGQSALLHPMSST